MRAKSRPERPSMHPGCCRPEGRAPCYKCRLLGGHFPERECSRGRVPEEADVLVQDQHVLHRAVEPLKGEPATESLPPVCLEPLNSLKLAAKTEICRQFAEPKTCSEPAHSLQSS